METRLFAARHTLRTTLVLLGLSVSFLGAEQFGLFTYQVVGGATVTITDYPDSVYGPADIPAVIDGNPVTGIGSQAFADCPLLTGVLIPDSVTSIGDQAFSDCSGLADVTLPAHLTAIPYGAFANCSSLGSVTIPAGVGGVGVAAFYNCSALAGVTITEGVSSIGELAFSESGLTSVFIPSSITSIGADAFTGCDELADVTLHCSIASMGFHAFDRSGITSVTIGAGVTSFDSGAFQGCSHLVSILVEPGNSQYASNGGVLMDATKSVLISYPAGKAGAYSIPEGIVFIHGGAFSGCIHLINVLIPSSVDTIGDAAFAGCTGLTAVTIPWGVTDISDYAFANCWLLRGVTIPGSVTRIGEGAFGVCSALASVTIPASVTEIGDSAFSQCSDLSAAVFLGDAPATFGLSVFDGADPSFTVYYLSSSSGFGALTWKGYWVTRIEQAVYPAAPWLLGHGLWYDTNLHQDLNGDGVDLLMAYALDLDPNLNLQASLPVAQLTATTLGIAYHHTSPGITYTVETSTDLQNWTTSGVNFTDFLHLRLATVPRDATRRFLRLSVVDRVWHIKSPPGAGGSAP